MAQILLKGGTALIHNVNEKVEAVKTNILIEGNKISKIATDLNAPEAKVIDVSNKIISPGFIDTHHHGMLY
jgi:cytosine/adenosine deaminase-related metal-dependent hydrolase